MALLPVPAALTAMLEAAPAMPAETVALTEALSRVLTAPVLAIRDQPPFRASAMDGWALRAEDGLTPRRVAGESAAGRAFAGVLGPGEAVRIFTGAPVPAGADHVVMQENARLQAGALEISGLGKANIRPQAQEFAAGEALLLAGQRIDGPRAAIIASAGAAMISVRRKPRIAILTLGEELVAPGAPAGEDQIYESVSFGLAGLIAQWGAAPLRRASLPDSAQALADAVARAEREADLIVIAGGASVGAYDVARTAIGARTMRVEKVAIRPGKPTWFAAGAGPPILGLPGNPASALVCARVFLRPLLEAMLGLGNEDRAESFWATLANEAGPIGERLAYLRCAVAPERDGRLSARLAPDQDSALARPFATCNALAILDPDRPAARAGDLVECLWMSK